ncbi:FecR family protein [Muriicola marianensis]|uniref:Iron dicitrate transporter FecR n=1 Tax=Muriicola marianensis TaxID=1324801 RepID=A0ABQ1R2Q1_9FLAO|nr:FecR domain-containing protein [Muriicola marianensis]GGD56007.1 iron dicitrate transporter FecR [Muriicola marianensis]
MEDKSLLEKWLNDSLTEAERETFQQEEAYPFYERLIADASHFKASQFSELSDFETLQKKIRTREVPVRKLHPTTWLLRIASVFVIGFALYYFILFPSEVKVETLAAQKTTIELPDESQVVLNALSAVTYNRRNWEDNRTLELKGEAFFDVAKGSRFDVVTPRGTVSVLGTEFNVKQRASAFEVICYEGHVRVVSGTQTEELRAGESLSFLDGKMTRGSTSLSGPQWKDNISDFREVPFSEVVAELERQYNVEVILEGVSANTRFTGGFVHDDLENALRSITEPLGLSYDLTQENKVILKTREK